MPYVDIADKTTLDALNTVANSAETDTQDIQSKIGVTNDTGGSSTSGSIMGKLNAALSVSAGGVNSVQRGVTSSATTVTITAVDVNKSFILSESKGSTGYAGATGTITGTLTQAAGSMTTTQYLTTSASSTGVVPGSRIVSGTIAANTITGTRSITAGTTNLTAKEFSAKLTSSTTVETDGPVEWQVIEFS